MNNTDSKLLLVDDDDVFRERMGMAMARRGFTVIVATDVKTALLQLDKDTPSYAVIDVRMPGESGLVLVSKLRAMSATMRIVVLTGFGSIANAVEAIKLGANDYLIKPADADQVTAALRGNQQKTFPNDDVLSLDVVEWEHIHNILSRTDWNISESARLLGIDRRTLQRKLMKYAPHRSI